MSLKPKLITLAPKPMAGLAPPPSAPSKAPALTPPPSKALKPIEPAQPKIEGSADGESIASIVAAVKAKPTPEPTIANDPLLDNMEEAFAPSSDLEIKLAEIEKLMIGENIPIVALKHGCDSIMKDLKASPDTVLELEPEQIKVIVQGYIAASSAEIQAVLKKKTKAPKKAKKPALPDAAKAALELAKQGVFDEEDF